MSPRGCVLSGPSCHFGKKPLKATGAAGFFSAFSLVCGCLTSLILRGIPSILKDVYFGSERRKPVFTSRSIFAQICLRGWRISHAESARHRYYRPCIARTARAKLHSNESWNEPKSEDGLFAPPQGRDGSKALCHSIRCDTVSFRLSQMLASLPTSGKARGAYGFEITCP